MCGCAPYNVNIRMQVIIIAGDSWSSNSLRSTASLEFYNHRNCLAQQLRNRLDPAVLVDTWAECGNSDHQQLSLLVQGLRHTPADWRITVVFGWSDWTRNTECDWRAESVSKDWQTARRTSLDRCVQLLRELECERVLHWGGQGQTPREIIPATHTVLYQDYAHEQFGHPPNRAGMLTKATSDPNNTVQRHFPDTNTKLARELDRSTRKLITYKHSHPRQYPDLGHLAWDLYAPLADKIVNTLQQ